MRSSLSPAIAFAPLAFGLLASCSGGETSEVPIDAGSTPDAGIPANDAGPADSGAANDAGSMAADAGNAANDAGQAADAGAANDAGAACQYPSGAVEPMALNEILTAYSWPAALHNGTGQQIALDLEAVHCNEDQVIDWSSTDTLLFVSVPAF